MGGPMREDEALEFERQLRLERQNKSKKLKKQIKTKEGYKKFIKQHAKRVVDSALYNLRRDSDLQRVINQFDLNLDREHTKKAVYKAALKHLRKKLNKEVI